ncbi:MAG TPA: hypothetical protein VH599_09565 [Ktedonobacterales bacterium]|jgi:hypothetical protein
MIRQFCRRIARVFGGHGGVRNLTVIFIIVAGLLLSCCFVLVAVANGTPGTIAEATATPGGGPQGQISTPTPTPTTAVVTPTPTPTTPSVTPSPTPPSNDVTPTLPPCNGTPTGSVPCKGPNTGGGPGSGPQSDVESGGTSAFLLVALLSLVFIAGGVTAALRVRRARGR